VSTIAKVFVVVVFALSVAFLVSSALLMTEQETWHNKFLELQKSDTSKIAAAEKKASDLDDQLKEVRVSFNKAKDDLARITDEKSALEKEKANLQAEVAAKEKGLNDLQASFLAIKSGIENWAQRNEKLQKDLTDAQAKLKDTEEALRQSKAECEKANLEKDQAMQKLTEAEARRKDAEDQLVRAKEALDKLVKIGAIKPEEVLGNVQKPIDGRVLEVDPANNIVVINVGKEQGVGLGYSFTVYRDSEYVGEIKVEQLQNDLAGAVPVAGTIRSEIRKGDNVTTRIR
jgi:predicted nuclease with TOPRIM domain